MLHRRFLMVFWSASARQLQVQEAGSATIVPFTPDGKGRPAGRVSRDGRERRLSSESHSTARCFVLSAEAGFCQGHACC